MDVEILLLKHEQVYTITERFKSTRHQNEILRGVYNDLGVAKIEFKKIANKLERVMPMMDFSLAY